MRAAIVFLLLILLVLFLVWRCASVPAPDPTAVPLPTDTAGTWYYYIIGEAAAGVNRGADQGLFVVRRKAT